MVFIPVGPESLLWFNTEAAWSAEGNGSGNYRHGRYSRSERAERMREMNERYWARRAQMPPPYRPWLD